MLSALEFWLELNTRCKGKTLLDFVNNFFFQFNIKLIQSKPWFSQQKAEWAQKLFETTGAQQDSTEAFLNPLEFKFWQAKKNIVP